jgi:hypothetical protein
MSTSMSFWRVHHDYEEVLAPLGLTVAQFGQAEMKIAAVNAKHAAEKAEAVELFESKKPLLEEFFNADPDARIDARDMAEKLGVPNTQSFRSRITRQVGELKRLRDLRAAG